MDGSESRSGHSKMGLFYEPASHENTNKQLTRCGDAAGEAT